MRWSTSEASAGTRAEPADGFCVFWPAGWGFESFLLPLLPFSQGHAPAASCRRNSVSRWAPYLHFVMDHGRHDDGDEAERDEEVLHVLHDGREDHQVGAERVEDRSIDVAALLATGTHSQQFSKPLSTQTQVNKLKFTCVCVCAQTHISKTEKGNERKEVNKTQKLINWLFFLNRWTSFPPTAADLLPPLQTELLILIFHLNPSRSLLPNLFPCQLTRRLSETNCKRRRKKLFCLKKQEVPLQKSLCCVTSRRTTNIRDLRSNRKSKRLRLCPAVFNHRKRLYI